MSKRLKNSDRVLPWVTFDGRSVPLSELGLQHLDNIIRGLEEGRLWPNSPATSAYFLRVMREEREYRDS